MHEDLLETWSINCRINAYFLEAVEEESLWKKPEKGKAVGAQFGHIHSVRGMWLKSSAPELAEGLLKPAEGATKSELLVALDDSAGRMEQALAAAFESGRFKGFKPHPTAFLGYLIAHEAHHRGQAELSLRQLGTPLPDKVAYGLWEWGVR